MRPAGSPYAVFQRALKHGNLWVAETEARELAIVSLEDALKLVHLYAEKESPKYERAAMRFSERYLTERAPTLRNFAKVVWSLEQREADSREE